MAGNSQVLREYLVALGFKVDASGAKKVDTVMSGMDKRAGELGTSILKVGTAVTAMVTGFAYQMEKMYYSSLKTNSSVGSLRALQYGAQQIGISGQEMQSALEGMSSALRANPGLHGLLSYLGIDSRGKQDAKIFSELLDKLESMPFFLAQRFGSQFGLDPNALYLMLKQNKELKKAQEEQQAVASAVGVDLEKAAKDGQEYANALRGVTERVYLLTAALGSALLPTFKEVSTEVNRAIDGWTKDFSKAKNAGDVYDILKYRSLLAMKRTFGLENYNPTRPEILGADPNASKGAPKASGNSALLSDLEKRYALPEGLLDRVWAAESSRGKNMRSPKGAMGHFGFMPNTAKAYGLQNPDDFAESAGASARMWADLLKQYGGDVRMAAAAYNWGSGNMAKAGITSGWQLGASSVPQETRGYLDKVAPSITQTNNINILGGDGQDTNRRLVDSLRTANADLVRQMTPRTR